MNEYAPTAHKVFFSRADIEPDELPGMEKLFFSNLVLKNGTFKTTNHHRLDDLNALVNTVLPRVAPLRLMDVAISSGISTAEWLVSLDSLGINYNMVAGDLTINAYLISAGFGLRVLVDDMGHPLQYDIWGHAVRRDVNRRGIALYFIPLFWLRFLSALLRPSLSRRPWPASLSSPVKVHGFTCVPIQLVSAELKANDKLTVLKDDILNDTHYLGTFHVIRAANILNRGYFSESTLSSMLRNLRRRMVTGGALIVCRTLHDDTNHATIFSLRADGRFEVLARLNAGSEIEALVLALPPNTA
jgi:hypothetical protein